MKNKARSHNYCRFMAPLSDVLEDLCVCAGHKSAQRQKAAGLKLPFPLPTPCFSKTMFLPLSCAPGGCILGEMLAYKGNKLGGVSGSLEEAAPLL